MLVTPHKHLFEDYFDDLEIEDEDIDIDDDIDVDAGNRLPIYSLRFSVFYSYLDDFFRNQCSAIFFNHI